MRAGIVVNVTRADRLRLEAIVADRSAPQKHGWRAKVILATADGCGTAQLMRRPRKSKPVVWTWQARFMAEGVEGLLRDKTRKPGKPPLPPNTVQRVVDLALGPPPGESTHWTGRELAKAAGVTRPTNISRYKNGWPGIPAGRSTSRLPRRPGLTPSKASSPNSRDGVSSVECSGRLPTFGLQSIGSLKKPTPIPNPSSGPLTPNASSLLSNEGKKS